MEASVSRPRSADHLSPLLVPPPHSSLFPFWSPTLFPKFLAWESRYQVPLPAVSFFRGLSFLICRLKMRRSLQALPAPPLVPPSFPLLSSHTLTSLHLCFLYPCLISFSSPTSPFLLSHLFLLSSLHLCPFLVSPLSSESGEGFSGMGAPGAGKDSSQSSGSSPSLNIPCLGWFSEGKHQPPGA